jgi:hypothetical protein
MLHGLQLRAESDAAVASPVVVDVAQLARASSMDGTVPSPRRTDGPSISRPKPWCNVTCAVRRPGPGGRPRHANVPAS